MQSQNEDLQSLEEKIPSAKPLLFYFSLSSACGLVLFCILIYAAWVNLRSEFTRHWYALNQVKRAHNLANDSLNESRSSPAHMDDFIQKMKSENEDQSSFWEDRWGHEIQFEIDEGGQLITYSFGRDGKLGGTGLDADVYHDDRNYEQTLPSFFEFYEQGQWTSSIVGDGGVFCFVVALALFAFLYRVDSVPGRPEFPVVLIFYTLVLVGLAGAFGVILLPLHVPTGH